MIKTLTFYDFCDEFTKMGRSEQFSYEAKQALYDYYEEYEPAYDLDVIEICCDWVEESIVSVLDDYGLDTLEELQNDTYVIEIDADTILYQNY